MRCNDTVHARRLVFRTAVLIAVFLFMQGCAGVPSGSGARSFDRGDLLIEYVNEQLEKGETAAVVDRVSYGLDRGLVDSDWARRISHEIAGHFQDRYRTAIAMNDFSTAIGAQWNLDQLARDPLGLGVSVDLESIRTRDELLLDWARHDLDRGEEVLALYRLLRRSTFADLSRETHVEFLEIAAKLNNDEAVERLMTAGDRSSEDVAAIDVPLVKGDRSPTEMLRGTVTVWVNKGIRISDGVGVPDRVIGSGFFVDPRGYLLTNYHVISSEVDPTYNGYSRLSIKLPGRPNERVPARVVGYDRIFDLALVKIEIDAPYVFSLSDTRRLIPGERVLALGSPGGLDSTITAGIVSAAGRRFLQMGEAVQIDAPVNPGNSGGALILPDGQVAGVVFAGIQQFEGVNFAIPAYWVRHFFPRLFDGEEVSHSWLGTAVHAGREGLRVVYVHPDSPADRAGVEVGHLLRAINGKDVSEIAAAQDIIMERQPGDILVTDWEVGEERENIRRIVSAADRPFSPVEEALKKQPIEALFPVLFGMNVDDVSGPPWGPDFVITNVLPGSIADESSLSPNDPFTLRNWRVDNELRAAFIQIIIRKRKAGFIESGVQLGAFLETDSFL